MPWKIEYLKYTQEYNQVTMKNKYESINKFRRYTKKPSLKNLKMLIHLSVWN